MKIKKKVLYLSHTNGNKIDIDLGRMACGMPDLDLTEMSDKAVFYSKDYAEIFGQTKKTSSQGNKQLSVVKISYKGKTIHREFMSLPGMVKQNVALTPRSAYLLGCEGRESEMEVTVEPGSKFFFYWDHPVHATRISTRLGIYSIVISLIGIIISLFSH